MATQREHLIQEHTEMLKIRREGIARGWKSRHKKDYRETMRWLIDQAKFHKHMITQISSLPDFDFPGRIF